MLPKELKTLIDRTCMGITPTDEQMDEIMDMAIALDVDSVEVASYINEKIANPTKKEVNTKTKKEQKPTIIEAEKERIATEKIGCKENNKVGNKITKAEKRNNKKDVEKRNSDMSKTFSVWEKRAEKEGIARWKVLRKFRKHYFGCSYAYERICEFDDGSFRPEYEVKIYRDGKFYNQTVDYNREIAITSSKFWVKELNDDIDNLTFIEKCRYLLTGKKKCLESLKYTLKDIGEHILVDCISSNDVPYVYACHKGIIVSNDIDGRQIDFVKKIIKYDALKNVGKVQEINIDNNWPLDNYALCWEQLLGVAKSVNHGLLVVNAKDSSSLRICKCLTQLVNGEVTESDFNGYVLLNTFCCTLSDITEYGDDYSEMMRYSECIERNWK